MNGIRNIDGVDVDAIDQYSGTKQNGNIRVACKEGTFHPDIFIGQNIWCKSRFNFKLNAQFMIPFRLIRLIRD